MVEYNENAAVAYGNFMRTLILLKIIDDDLIYHKNKVFYFMRDSEFKFCDKWGVL